MEYYVEIYDLSKHVYLFITLVCIWVLIITLRILRSNKKRWLENKVELTTLDANETLMI